jgi:hypothetical protein
VPGDERATKAQERCAVHGSSPSVAACDICGRRMCLACAIPVRGGAVGTECLAVALGPDAPVAETVEANPGALARATTTAAFLVAVVATVLPWSRFGAGSGMFGAWSDTMRWSMVAATASVLGLCASIARRTVRRSDLPWWWILVALATVAAVASALAIAWPPAFTSPWLGPWISVTAAVGALVTSLWDATRRRADV